MQSLCEFLTKASLSRNGYQIVKGILGASGVLVNILKYIHPEVYFSAHESPNKAILNPELLLLTISILKSLC